MSLRKGVGRWLATAAFVIGLAVGTAPAGNADPTGGPPDPYPDGDLIIRSYHPLAPEEFFVDNSPGVWFLSPSGLNCGIFDYKGSFGCAGNIPGAPKGATHISWYNGNTAVRYDPIAGIQFPRGQATRTLPPRNSVSYNGTTCTTMADTSTYCERGPFRFFVTSTQTWLTPPEHL